jgi:hypothetical protein
MRMSRLAAGVAILLLVCFAVQAWLAARSDSVTIDEFADLPVGLAMIRTGDTGLDPINPPLSRIFFALSQLPDPPRFDPEGRRLPFRLGEEFMRENADRYHERFVRARVLVILLALLVGMLVHRWARLLYGPGSALVALFLFTFSPDMLAHGYLVTADLAGALGFIAAAFATWVFFGRPSPPRALLLGGAIGLGALLKLSGVVAAARASPASSSPSCSSFSPTRSSTPSTSARVTYSRRPRSSSSRSRRTSRIASRISAAGGLCGRRSRARRWCSFSPGRQPRLSPSLRAISSTSPRSGVVPGGVMRS